MSAHRSRAGDEPRLLAAARRGDHDAFRHLTDPHRRGLHLHCYRMLGSFHDAEDVLQETLLRAWRRLHTFGGRSRLRTWLYAIATNACLDALDGRQRRILPTAYGPSANPQMPVVQPAYEVGWLGPYPDALLSDASALDDPSASPELRYTLRESVALAFLAAIQYLPPRQRAALILCDVLGWPAAGVARVLDATVASVNSALQRARVTLRTRLPARPESAVQISNERDGALADRYMHAWETANLPALVALLKDDAVLSMPPYVAWFAGREAIAAFLAVDAFEGEARGRLHLTPTRANGQPAFGVYRRDPGDGMHRALAIKVLTIDGGQIAEITGFAYPDLFSAFDLPAVLDRRDLAPPTLHALG